MSYALNISLALGATQTGLTLSAQLVDTAGNDVGAAVTSGFTEVGGGNYSWYYAAFPDGFTGGVRFSAGGTLEAFVAVSPADAGVLSVGVSGPGGLSAAAADWLTVLGNLRARIIEVTASANPDYSVGGRSVSKASYLATLQDQYDKALSQYLKAGGNFIARSRGSV